LANNNITWLPEKDAAKEKYGRLVTGRQPVDDDTVVVTIWYVYFERFNMRIRSSSLANPNLPPRLQRSVGFRWIDFGDCC
jgi:hypothetical protein